MPVTGIAYAEVYAHSSHAGRWADSLAALGFRPSGYRELPGRDTLIMLRGTARLLLSSPHHASAAEGHVDEYGDGVADLAFLVDDVRTVWRQALEAGAAAIQPPVERDIADIAGLVSPDDARAAYRRTQQVPLLAVAGGTGSIRHTLLQVPGLAVPGLAVPGDPDLAPIDHAALAAADPAKAGAFYAQAFGFAAGTSAEAGHEPGTAVLRAAAAAITLVPPRPPRSRGPADGSLAVHGAGVQHLAVSAAGIVQAVRQARERGTRFRPVPGGYYEEVAGRLGYLPADLRGLEAAGVLIDADGSGRETLRALAVPAVPPSAFFFELITRRAAGG